MSQSTSIEGKLNGGVGHLPLVVGRDGKPNLPVLQDAFSTEFLIRVSLGLEPGFTFDRKFGAVDAIQAAVAADVWSYGITPGAELYTFSADGVADIDTLSSSDPGDTEEITTVGLAFDGAEVIQRNILDGQNKVPLQTPLWRHNRSFNSNGTNLVGEAFVYVDGAITAGVPDDPATVRGHIPIGKGQTLQAIYTIPKGFTGLFIGLEASLTKGVGATAVSGVFSGAVREFGKVFRVQDEFLLISTGTSNKTYNFPITLPFIEKSDFCPQVDVSANGIGASWAFTLLLVENHILTEHL